ncbi:MAG: GDSL family lipase [Rhodospirillaceae bacterium]|nr:GDSL family lipase [Rhodospirillaceae bacterium]
MRICFFGESYVNGTGDPTTQGWVGRLCAAAISKGHALTVYNCGIRGATSTLVRDTWFAEAIARFNPDEKFAAVFSYGTNDCWRENGAPKVPLETHLHNTNVILEEASMRWPALFVGPPGLPTYADDTLRIDDHVERCARTQKLCAELNVPYFDTLSVYGGFKQWHAEAKAGDGAHPGGGGYAEMAAALDCWPAWVNLLA